MYHERSGIRKTIPRSHRNHGEKKRKPDAPQVSVKVSDKITCFVPGKVCEEAYAGRFASRRATLEFANQFSQSVGESVTRISGILLKPRVFEPLTPSFVTGYGGGRVGGGGTSEEALRRAKQKAK